jgi:FlaA1/EpsC-like NDP-sugar epimerase
MLALDSVNFLQRRVKFFHGSRPICESAARQALPCEDGEDVSETGGLLMQLDIERARLDVVSWRPLIVDALLWSVGLTGATVLSAGDLPTASLSGLLLLCLYAAVGQVVVGIAVGVYRGRAVLASFDELVLLVVTVGVVAGVLALSCLSLHQDIYPKVAGIGAVVALLLMTGARAAWRLRSERAVLTRNRSGERTIVFGAGEGGYRVIRALLRGHDMPYNPVALLDDDKSKRFLRVMGIPVLGGRESIAEIARRRHATVLLIAIPSASGKLLQELSEPCQTAGLTMKVVPSVHELVGGQARVGDIRDIRIADVLGRPPSLMDPGPMAAYLRGKKVLVTGAGGSIGSELCRVLTAYAPGQILMLDRDESALHAVQLTLEGRALLDSPSVILADIRDTEALIGIFDRHRPDIVFHAAALKHLPLLERYPGEAVKTNVWGTLAVLAACNGVSRFVNISTDKAADPISVLGTSKRAAERVVAHGRPGTTCVSVRFGNVLGSRGSVLHTFAAQVKAGGPITVTHPDATRYFMTVTEAVHLVIAAGGIGYDGEALVLDMGEPARILDVAKLVSASSPVPIHFTGLRQGEKLHEQLFGAGEIDFRPIHPLISHVAVPPLDPVQAYALDTRGGPNAVIEDLAHLAAASDLAVSV